jgi:hypothetical protein
MIVILHARFRTDISNSGSDIMTQDSDFQSYRDTLRADQDERYRAIYVRQRLTVRLVRSFSEGAQAMTELGRALGVPDQRPRGI